MGLYSRVKNWADGFVLPASELNTEFDAVKDAVNAIEDINVKAGADIDCAKLKDDTLVNAKVNSDADIAVSKIDYGAADGISGWHGDVDRIKILPQNFVTSDDASPEQSTVAGIISTAGATADVLVAVPIPMGYKATAVRVYSSVIKTVDVYECNIANSSSTSKGSGNTTAEIDITDVTADGTNYLVIKVSNLDGSTVYGGYVTIEKT